MEQELLTIDRRFSEELIPFLHSKNRIIMKTTTTPAITKKNLKKMNLIFFQTIIVLAALHPPKLLLY